MKKIMQFRYRGEGSKNNFPNYKYYEDALINGNIFKDYGFISQLGIQGPVGLRFYLNSNTNPIMIGETGIYELDLENVGRITSIQFDANDLSKFYTKELQSDQLLIDIVYEGGL